MRQTLNHVVAFRLVTAAPQNEHNGAARIRHPETGVDLLCIFSDGEGWDHVSVSTRNRCPNWPEMSFVKDIFFDPEECVIQYHPPRSTYVNCHPYCLHLWKPHGIVIPLPDPWMVGPR